MGEFGDPGRGGGHRDSGSGRVFNTGPQVGMGTGWRMKKLDLQVFDGHNPDGWIL